MPMYTSLDTTPSVSPLDVAYVKSHARIYQDYDDTLLAGYLLVATELVENYLSRYLLTKTATWTTAHAHHHGFGSNQIYLMPWQWTTFLRQPVMPLPRPVSNVSTVVLGYWSKVDATLVEGVDYRIDTATSLGRIEWISNLIMDPDKKHLQVTFSSGYGDTQAAVPVGIQHALLLLTTALYERRGDDSPEIWSPAVESLLAPHRYVWF